MCYLCPTWYLDHLASGNVIPIYVRVSFHPLVAHFVGNMFLSCLNRALWQTTGLMWLKFISQVLFGMITDSLAFAHCVAMVAISKFYPCRKLFLYALYQSPSQYSKIHSTRTHICCFNTFFNDFCTSFLK